MIAPVLTEIAKEHGDRFGVEPIAFYPDDAGQVLVEVHQVVRDLTGVVLADEHVGHRFTMKHDLIQAMEACPLS